MRYSLAASLAVALALLSLAGCDSCRQFSKGKTIADKDSAAFCYLENGQYESAALIFEELLSFYRASPRGEVIQYNYALAKFKQGEYLTAAYYFDRFVQQYPNSQYADKAALFTAQAYDNQSASYELDQAETEEAMEQYALYIDEYPDSELADSARQRIEALDNKLAHKAFSHANLYFKIGHYKAAVVTFKNMLQDYPRSPYSEEAQYKLFRSQMKYAEGSVEEKQEERYLQAMAYYLRFVDRHPQSKFVRPAEKLYDRLNEILIELKESDPDTEKTGKEKKQEARRQRREMKELEGAE